MTLFLLLAAAILLPAGPQAQWKTPWTYDGATGPDHWGDLDPDYAACKNGRQQSPIDITRSEKQDLPALRFVYRSAPLKYLINNGATIRVNYHDAPATGNFLLVGDQRYQLTQFHFHHPGEELLHGQPAEMDLHLMHQSGDGKVVGVAVPLKTGAANSTVQQIWDHLPVSKGNEQEIPGVSINPAGLLPRDLGYFSYSGSLTAPPCTEGVTWIVLKTPVEISSEQIQAFAKLYPQDVRPAQPLNGRSVKESK
jgi:carbonic anhydrase